MMITGTTGDDVLDGGSGDDTLYGLEGNDILNGGLGADVLYGSYGDDTYYVDDPGDVVVEVNGEGTDLVRSYVSFSIYATFIENLSLIGWGNVNATGNAGNNILTGNGGNNVINGDAGADTMAGGEGNDAYFIDNSADTVIEKWNQGYDKVYSAVTFRAGGQYIEYIQLAGTSNIDAIGNNQDNTLVGNSGNNVLNGLTGIDDMRGGLGNDTYYVDDSRDSVTEKDGEGTDLLYASSSYSLYDHRDADGNLPSVENLRLLGTGNFSLRGNLGDNILAGNSGHNALFGDGGNDLIFGLLGNDTIDGGTGADHMYGGAGNDTYYVDNTGDRVVEQSVVGVDDGGIDTVISSVNYALPAYVENLLIHSGTGAGNALDNVLSTDSLFSGYLFGLGGNDTLYSPTLSQSASTWLDGGDGNDKLYAQSTYSSLTGGAGADAFIFSLPEYGAPGIFYNESRIVDFKGADGDTIDVSFFSHGSTADTSVWQQGANTIIYAPNLTITVVNTSANDPNLLSHIIW